MSKPSKSGLTASRKKRVRRRRPERLDVDLLDGLMDHCRSLTTLARLLEACDHHAEAPPLESALVHQAGYLLFREAEQLHELLAELGKAAR